MRILSFFKTSFLQATLRFNLAIACCACLTYSLIFSPPFLTNIPYVDILLCGISWFIASKLFTEGLALPKWPYYILSIPVFMGGSYYFYFYPNSFLVMGTLFLTFMSFIFIAPFVSRSSDSDELWSFHFDILKNSIFAGIASLILLIGTNLVLLAMDYLFGFIPYQRIYLDTFIVIGVLILPVMKLSGIPTTFEDHTYTSTGAVLLKLLLYILISLLLIYGIILHAYSLKIMITQELPRGKVSYLVACFETLMVAVYVLVQRWKTEHSMIRLFHRYVGLFMIVPLMLMAWGLWARIATFGLTESRYFIALLWLWFVACTLIMLIRTLNPALWIIGIFSSLSLISSIGPWSIEELPVRQQVHKLKTTLSKVRSAEKHPVTKEQQIIVSSILDYLNNRHRLEAVRSLYLNPNTLPGSKKLTPANVSLELGVPYLEYSERAQKKTSYSAHYKMTINNLPISGYSYMIPNIRLSTYGALSHSFEIKDIGSFRVSYTPTTHSFEITQKGVNAHIYKAHMPDLIDKLTTGSKTVIQANPKLTTQTKNEITIQVIFTEVSGIINNPISSSLDSINDITCTVLFQRTPKK